ncbi:rCG23556 [Rattus norvegicus]|uniref:RCG23556 n=1 Tax=Rattus norvegicus TaxID=10116 RepID=A6KH74_RAT|nr:mast cell protease 8 precursor [Rattus norvegicus]EDM14303.1 rCG23556 [Rattus norvegicus]|eukprot:NP_067609.1 mast cell protease 8 precursor [Rattus norvegicus]
MFLFLFFLVAILPVNTEGGEIIWGTESKPHSRPYMASLMFYYGNSYRHYCGGFLVAKDIVMTAAHCNGSNIKVTLGAHNIKKQEKTQVIAVVKAKPHENYDRHSRFNDIMLLKLERKAQLNGAVKTIALPRSQDWVKPGQVCTVAGWGCLANCSLSNTLQEVNLEVQEGQKCEDMSRNYNDSIQLCVGNPSEGKATGKGDSGGPFVCDGVAQGIVSYRLCTGTLPRVFTRISSFIPWIQKTMKLLQQS